MTKTTVTLQRIGATQTETGWATGTVVPDPSKIADHRLIRRKLINGESVRIASYAYANAWNGKPQRYSSQPRKPTMTKPTDTEPLDVDFAVAVRSSCGGSISRN